MSFTQNYAQTLANAFHLANADRVREEARRVWGAVVDACMEDAPSGSGIDCGTKLDEDRTNASRIVLICEYHHMNEHGYYDGWTSHKIIVTPTFQGIDVRITGRDRNMIKDYLADVYHAWLTAPCPHNYGSVVVPQSVQHP